jgi:glycosyltransferase involved in cell wall biosynthesis
MDVDPEDPTRIDSGVGLQDSDTPLAERMPIAPAPGGAARYSKQPHGTPPFVCFSGQDWWYHNRAHSDFQLMLQVARSRPVLLVNSIAMRMPLPGRSTQPFQRILRKARSISMGTRQPFAGLPFHVLSPVIFPLYGLRWARRFNAWLVRRQVEQACSRLGIRKPVVFATIPTAWDVLQGMDRSALVFNRADKSSEFGEADQSDVRRQENALLSSADLVLYVSRALMDDERALAGDRARFLDHGVDLELFSHETRREEPEDLRSIPRPRIGFFGGFDDYVIDFDLLERVATEFPWAQLVLVGHTTCSMERLVRHPNVHWLGQKQHDQIPAYGSGFDVALMPWLDNDWIRNCNPIKMKEYLALGLPVVSTDFPEVRRYSDVIRVARNSSEFVQMVRATLADGGPCSPEERRQRVQNASWARKALQMIGWIDEAGRIGKGCAASPE